MAADEPGLWKL